MTLRLSIIVSMVALSLGPTFQRAPEAWGLGGMRLSWVEHNLRLVRIYDDGCPSKDAQACPLGFAVGSCQVRVQGTLK